MKNKRKGDWMTTQLGIRFWPMDPRTDEIFIEDIAFALSKLCRFGGHANRFYSVAEHSVHIGDYLLRTYHDEKIALGGLLHDAAEAYVGDLQKPVKHHPYLRKYRRTEERILKIICKKYAVNCFDEKIKTADSRILTDEAGELMGANALSINRQPLDVIIKYWSHKEAATWFLQRYKYLNGGSQ